MKSKVVIFPWEFHVSPTMKPINIYKGDKDCAFYEKFQTYRREFHAFVSGSFIPRKDDSGNYSKGEICYYGWPTLVKLRNRGEGVIEKDVLAKPKVFLIEKTEGEADKSVKE